jgi:hypothetical protein
MLSCRVAVDSKIAALQHRKTATQRITLNALLLASSDLFGGYDGDLRSDKTGP